MAEDVTVSITADTAPFQSALEGLQKMSDRFGVQLTGALKSAAVHGRELDDVLRRVGLNLAGLALEQGLKPLQTLAGAQFSALLGGISGVMPFAKGGAVRNANVVPFASGGVISSPSYFPLGRNIGLAGEAGAEAILPLQRSADGRLGVAATGTGGAPVNVVFNVTTQDAQSFRRSEAQITGMLARAVSRGSRTF
ncbi:phage tail tape measure protein [Pseudaminobacter arsenicus]|uniref:Phage tail tape measure protein n=1 Tax=Borborobacter arsenicus TaxID=1851146 RepID=A0A432V5A3_9HYPH|nr:phage tail tape measure protein [Pseudaminobacter arsenicus]RUM97334.1 phage tail tape measure protein [Pseudaminobacter arsenicus]